MDIAETKSALRAKVLAARSGMTPRELLAAADNLFERLMVLLRGYQPKLLTTYAPIGSEPGGAALPDRLAAALPGATLLLPVLLPDLDLDWSVYRGPSSLARTPRGLYEPTGPRLGPEAVTTAQVIIVPALAADVHGFRLGRGGGSYDRTLARAHPDSVSIALLHDGELLARVPYEPHDLPVTHALTPTGR